MTEFQRFQVKKIFQRFFKIFARRTNVDFTFTFYTTLIWLEMTKIWPEYVVQVFLTPPPPQEIFFCQKRSFLTKGKYILVELEQFLSQEISSCHRKLIVVRRINVFLVKIALLLVALRESYRKFSLTYIFHWNLVPRFPVNMSTW